MAKFATHMGEHGDPQTSPQHANLHGFLVWFASKRPQVQRIGVLWAGLRVAMWITHVGGKFHHVLLEKSLRLSVFVPFLILGLSYRTGKEIPERAQDTIRNFPEEMETPKF